ncbi:MAG: hypothetical protein EBS86_12445 [Crocinitomicaceae bacterium]|nr:hypothetical protein [Crocinitomicaceae bacterium]
MPSNKTSIISTLCKYITFAILFVSSGVIIFGRIIVIISNIWLLFAKNANVWIDVQASLYLYERTGLNISNHYALFSTIILIHLLSLTVEILIIKCIYNFCNKYFNKTH